MGTRDKFDADEWARLVQAPMLASMAVTAADPSGLVGSVQEATATSKAMLEALRREGSLASEIVSAFEDGETRKSVREGAVALARDKSPAEVSAAAVEELSGVAALVRRKAPEQAAEFSAWLRDLAARVAEAGTEGGFLGIGGEKVSEAEKKTLDDLDAALGGGA